MRLKTKEFAGRRRVEPGTVLSRYSKTGSYFGIRPEKQPNGRLLWPDDDAAALNSATTGAQEQAAA